MSPPPTTRQVPLCRPSVDSGALDRLREVLESGHLVEGRFVRQLEEQLSSLLSAPAVAVSSGTAALWLAVDALGLGPGDEVLVPSIGFPAFVHAVQLHGAVPVAVDVSEADWALDPALAARAITPATRALLAVDSFGVCADWPALEALAATHGLRVIEDAACALGARGSDGRQAGTYGDIACFSFHPRKIVTTGEGGAVVSRQPELVERARDRAHLGLRTSDALDQRFTEIGWNLRLSDVHAAIGVGQMQELTSLVEQRQHVAAMLTDGLRSLPIAPLSGLARSGSVPQSFVCTLDETLSLSRDAFIQRLAAHGVQATIASYAAHRMPFYTRRYGWRAESFPVAERIWRRGVTLPCFPGMDAADVDGVIDSVRAVCSAA